MAKDENVTDKALSPADAMKEAMGAATTEEQAGDSDPFNDEGDDSSDGEVSVSDEVDNWAKGTSASVTPQNSGKGRAEEGRTSGKQPENSETVEYIQAGGRKVKVDFTDKEAIRLAVKRAEGMRQFQRERDELKRKWDAETKVRESNKERLSLLSHLEKEYEDKGLDGAIFVLTGGKKTLDDIVKERSQRTKLFEDATDDERRVFEYEEKLTQRDKEMAKINKRLADYEARHKEVEETSSVTKLQAMVTPVFDKFRFAGRIEDAEAAEELDSVLFERLRAVIAAVPEDREITPAFIQQQTKLIADRLSRTIKIEATATAKEQSEAAKRAAKGTAQVAASKGFEDSDARMEFAKKIKSGNTTAAFLDVMRGKVKL